MPNRARDWLAQGRRALELARHAAAGGFWEWACFAAQQAAEKGLEALIAALNGEARGHSIVAMAAALPANTAFPAELLERRDPWAAEILHRGRLLAGSLP